MQSSPFVSSLPEAEHVEAEPIVTKTISVVAEEHLDQAKADFDTITSIFVYSLEPGPLADLNVLSDCTREMLAQYATEDPLQAWKQYGVIQNPEVRRRTGKRPAGVPMPAAVPSKPAPKAAPPLKREDSKPTPSDTAAKAGVTAGTAVRDKAGAHAGPVSDLSTAEPAAPPPRRDKSGIFASFAKAKSKPKRDSGNAEVTADVKDGKVANTAIPTLKLTHRQNR